MEAAQLVVIEGGDEEWSADLADRARDRLSGIPAFQFYVDGDLGRDRSEHLFECRDGLAGAGIKLAQRRQRQRRDLAAAVRGAVHTLVVDDDEPSIGGQVHVELDRVDA